MPVLRKTGEHEEKPLNQLRERLAQQTLLICDACAQCCVRVQLFTLLIKVNMDYLRRYGGHLGRGYTQNFDTVMSSINISSSPQDNLRRDEQRR